MNKCSTLGPGTPAILRPRSRRFENAQRENGESTRKDVRRERKTGETIDDTVVQFAGEHQARKRKEG